MGVFEWFDGEVPANFSTSTFERNLDNVTTLEK